MSSRIRCWLAFATVLLLLPGCSLLHAPHLAWPWKKKAHEAAKTPQFAGTIALVNEEASFVLIDNGTAPSPASGTVLDCKTAGVSSGQLKVTQIRKPPFVVADIVKGTPKKGDQAFQ